MQSSYRDQRQHVIDHLNTVGTLRRYRLLLHGASEKKAAGRLLPLLIVFIMLPVGAGALVEDHLGVWTVAIITAAFAFDVWLFLRVLRWAGLHGLTIARMRAGTRPPWSSSEDSA